MATKPVPAREDARQAGVEGLGAGRALNPLPIFMLCDHRTILSTVQYVAIRTIPAREDAWQVGVEDWGR